MANRTNYDQQEFQKNNSNLKFEIDSNKLGLIIKESLDEVAGKCKGDEGKPTVSATDIEVIKNRLSSEIQMMVYNSALNSKLSLLFEYEKHYLDLVKDYKEEIKFAASLQEDIRKERANFFASTLKEVSKTLKDTDVDSKVTASWIEELVSSYTKSLDLSSDLAKEQTFETFGVLKKESKESVNDKIKDNKIKVQ
jgi:hypothetical protein